MEDLFRTIADAVALGVEAVAILLVAVGALEATMRIVSTLVSRPATHGQKKETWRRFGTWLLLGLEFELAADIVRSVVAPSWMEIGQLGAIAAIRTFLNYFLERDLDHAELSPHEGARASIAESGVLVAPATSTGAGSTSMQSATTVNPSHRRT